MTNPSVPELVSAASACRSLAGARKLAAWMGSGRTLTGSGLLRPADAVQACRHLGIELQVPRLRSASDVEELAQYWDTALAAGLIVIEGRRAAPAERETLDAWFSAVDKLLDLDGEVACPSCLVALNTLYEAEVPLDLEEFVATVEDGLMPGEPDEANETGGEACPGCGGIHDDFLEYYLGDDEHDDDEDDAFEHIVAVLSLLADFGAVTISTAETVHLAPLGRYLAETVFQRLAPLPDAGAASVALAASTVPPGLVRVVAGPWLKARSASDAVRELLTFAESAGGNQRIVALAVAREVGTDSAEAWREWAKQPGFGAYARHWLASHDEPGALEQGDAAWLAVDAACLMAAGFRETMPEHLVHELVAEQFGEDLAATAEFMRTSDHPQAEELAAWLTAPDERWRPEPGTPVYKLMIELRWVGEPQVWRKVLVPAQITLDDLHDVIQEAMGWEDDHLHSFTTGRKEHAGDRLLDEVLAKRSDQLRYTYDFGDDWDHDIRLEEVLRAEAGVTYPSCVAGEGACPPEDCGGAGGYADLKEILADPSDEEYPERLEWMGLDDGKDFDPAEFSLAEVNERLQWFTED